MKIITGMKQYNINGFTIMACNMREALEYVYVLNNPIVVVAHFSFDDEDKQLQMLVQVGYQSQFIEDSIAIAVEDRLEQIGLSYDYFTVRTVEGKWLSTSEL